jgi:hypothetical protein
MANRRASYRNRDIGGPPKDQPWSWYSVEMMQSDAWRDMSVNARRMLDLLETEYLMHGGYENGNLIITYDQFVAGGIRRESISATIAELERLGWLEVTRGLYRGFARSTPHRFRLTHRRTRVRPERGTPYLVEPTHDWRQYRSEEPKRMVPEPALPQYRNRHRNGEIAAGQLSNSAAPALSGSVPVPAPLYISRVEGGRPARRDDHFGNCPECGRTDGCLSVGSDHWYHCRMHRTKWWVGSNLFSGWRDQSEDDWARNDATLSLYRAVIPVFPIPEDPWEALGYIEMRLGWTYKVLEALEAAVMAFAVVEPSFEQAAVARFIDVLLGQLSGRRRPPITRREIKDGIACPF